MRITCWLLAFGLGGCGRESAAEAPEGAPVAEVPAAEAPAAEGLSPVAPRPAGGVGVEPDGGAAFGGLLGEPVAEPLSGMGMRGEGPQNGGPKYPSLADVKIEGHGSGEPKDALYILHVEAETVMGPLSPDPLRGFFAGPDGAATCDAPHAVGEVVLRLTVGADGVVSERKLVRSTVQDGAGLSGCLLRLPVPTLSSGGAPSVAVVTVRYSMA